MPTLPVACARHLPADAQRSTLHARRSTLPVRHSVSDPSLATRPSSLDHRPALLPHELRNVVRPAPALPRRPGPLPTTERLRAGPRTGRRAGALVGVAHAGLDLVEETLHLGGIAREDAGREPVLRPVGLDDRVVEPR